MNIRNAQRRAPVQGQTLIDRMFQERHVHFAAEIPGGNSQLLCYSKPRITRIRITRIFGYLVLNTMERLICNVFLNKKTCLSRIS